MKKFLVSLLAALLLTANVNAIDLYVDFGRLSANSPPVNVDGRVLVPVRAIFEALGATVEWDAATRTSTGIHDGTTVVLKIDSTTAYVNGEAKTLDVPAQLINDRAMVPARFISEALGYDVTWYQPTQTSAVSYQLKEYNFYVSEDGDLYHFNSTCNNSIHREADLAEVMGRGFMPCVVCVPADIVKMFFEAPLPEPDHETVTTTPSSGDDSAAPTPSGTTSGAVGSSTGKGTTGSNTTPASGGTSSGNSSSSNSNSGSWGTDSTTNEITGSLSRTAYWTPNGKSYHFSSSCPSLSRSKTIRKGTLRDALKAGKTDPCNNCAGGK